MRIVEEVASWSKDTSSKYGAAIIRPSTKTLLAIGYNGIPRGIQYVEAHHSRPDKYMYWVHAEQNAIFNGAREGVRPEGCAMYVLKPPCSNCAAAIIQAGITEVVFKEPHSADSIMDTDSNWRLTIQAATEMLSEAGVRLRRM